MIKWPRPLFSLVGCPLGRSDPSLRHYKSEKVGRPVKILQTGMARTPPPPQACSSPECTYVTPTGVPTRDLVTTYLTNHTNTCHAPTACETPPQPSSKYGETTQTYLCTGYARGSLGIQDSSVEGLHRASGSLRQSKVTAATGSLHTRPAENLRRWAGSYTTLTSTTLLMNKMEKIAVVMVHKAVHIMNMWNMTHQSDESIRGFAASITGIADLCGMILECIS